MTEVIARKFADSLERWQESSDYAGIKAFPAERKWIDLAWAGQSEAYAYPFLRLGSEFGLPDIEGYVQRGIDFITTSPFTEDGSPFVMTTVKSNGLIAAIHCLKGRR